ncbi:hypothetical protein DID99_35395 [Burkholderia sp. Bp8986]|nr:hypothetical protein DID99_35395 [Burkholderia sp. Bp8986]
MSVSYFLIQVSSVDLFVEYGLQRISLLGGQLADLRSYAGNGLVAIVVWKVFDTTGERCQRSTPMLDGQLTNLGQCLRESFVSKVLR